RAAGDAHQPAAVRRAAILGLGRTANREVTPALFRVLDAGDEDLAHAAASALAWSGDAAAIPGLLTRALLPQRFALTDAAAPISALDTIVTNLAAPDEARLLGSQPFDLDAALMALFASPPHRDLTPLLRAHARALQDALAEGLKRGGDSRREALAVLDGRGNGPGLGPPSAEEDATVPPDAVLAVQEIVLPLADRVAALLDDPDPEIQASALGVLVKLRR